MDGQLARQASIRMVLGIAAVKDWELRQLDVDMAYLEAGVKEEVYIELPEEYRNSCDQMGRLQKAMYGLVHAGLLWSKTFTLNSPKGVRAMSGRPMRVQASTARESRRHHRGIRRRPAGGERNEARRGAGNK